MSASRSDRFGLGWRPALAASILSNLDRIEVLEVMAEDFATPAERRALRTLSRQMPVLVHGVSLGLASTSPVHEKRLTAVARAVEAAEPDWWSEHLAFVRADGTEIGHLAAPPRTAAVLEGALRNLERAAHVVGRPPLVENVATLVDPPGSTMDEGAFVASAVRAHAGGMLLDLHNLHANAVNFGIDTIAFLDRLPAAKVVQIHLAGGRWIPAPSGGRRLLDDHLHDVPDPVYTLLVEAGRRFPGPLTVTLERDGHFPSFDLLLADLDRARTALAEGRRRLAA